MSLQVPTPGGLTAKAPVGRSEYGRVKVALPRGKGLLDWIHKSTGKNLASARLPKVTAEELVKHNKQGDCWVLLFGQVYDVSPYLDYHPGGVPELMRAAGTDATALFNQYHSWVNYESMLKACVVGRFDGDTSKLPPPGPSTLDDDDSSSPVGAGASGEMNALAHSTLDSHNIRVIAPTPHSLLLSCPSHWNERTMRAECVSHSIGETSLRLLVKTMDGRSPLELKWDPLPSSFTSSSSSLSLSIDVESRIRLDFSSHTDAESDTVHIGMEMATTRCTVKERPAFSFHEARVLRIRRHSSLPSSSSSSSSIKMETGDEPEVTSSMSLPRDCLLLVVETDETASVRVPIGHHVEIRVRKGGSQVARPYTPIPLTPALREWIGGETEEKERAGRLLVFMIKVYSDGIVTPAIEKLNKEDLVHISDPIGSLDFACLPYSFPPPSTVSHSVHHSPINEVARNVICLAAGTGITPMGGVIAERGWEKCRLIAYNKTEEDTPRGEWIHGYTDSLVDESRLVHVLSASNDSSWKGARGRINRENMGEMRGSEIVFVCGPDGFVQEAARLLQEAGHPSDLVHIFQG
ncbi:hypothetical protein PFISCL1PPCAC_21610 [Pristionchus fissidentatus]|uniref:Cytochrome-b5 reductase n=1 Tax=Pristionchus fissidentatus TaxID=1538716 RepID=A0AAV5WJ24_9BILA|nr:hypothetical protein PFISCL1PPCAC_21610 [Pristionchus fissidentatus]